MATTRTKKAIVDAPIPKGPGSIYTLGRTVNGSEYKIDASKRGTYETYYQMYRKHPVMRGGIDKIAKTAVSNGYRFVPIAAGMVVTEDDPAILFLKTFFRNSKASQLLRKTYKDLLIYGESFWLIVGLKADAPVKALRLHPKFMDPQIDNGTLTGWRFGPVYETSKGEEYEAREVIHFVYDDPNSDIAGLSPIASLMRTVATDLFAMTFNEKFFENAATSGLILSMKSTDAAEIKRNREWLEQNYVGTENAHRPMILEGEIEVHEGLRGLDEMQFIEGRKLNRQEILSVLDIDPTKLGIHEDANRSISKEADNTFRSETIATLTSIVEDEITESLIRDTFGIEDKKFEQQEESLRTQLDSMKLLGGGQDMGVFSVNDILDVLGRPHVDGGEVHFLSTPSGPVPLALLTEFATAMMNRGQQPPVDHSPAPAIEGTTQA